MKADALQKLIEAGNEAELIATLWDVSRIEPVERVKVVKFVFELGRNDVRSFCAWLAFFRLATWKDIQRRERLGGWVPERFTELIDLLVSMFIQQPPDWIEQWATLVLDHWQSMDWSWIRRLVQAGVIQRPATFNYLYRMPRDIKSLRADPAALQHEIFELFELVTTRTVALIDSRDIDLAADVHYSMLSFAGTLRQLQREGMIDRNRLLEASLKGLQIGRKPADALWFYRFHEFLEPTVEERQELQRIYCDLLSSQVSAVATFALEALTLLQKSGRLNGALFFSSTERVFDLKAKTTGAAALRLLALIARDDASLKPDIARAAVAGLAHGATDVQSAAIAVLEKLAIAPDERIAEAIAARAEGTASSLKPRVRKLIELYSETVRNPDHVNSSVCRNTLSNDEPILNSSASRLAPEFEIVPINTLDELIEAASAAVETLDRAEDLERLLDGLSRLCDQRPVDFAARTAPLAKRIEKLLASGQPTRFLEQSLSGAMLVVLQKWLSGKPSVRANERASTGFEPAALRSDRLLQVPPVSNQGPTNADRPADRAPQFLQPFNKHGVPVLNFLQNRIAELTNRLLVGDARPLLAAPTHRGGWIAASALIDRLRVLEREGLDPHSVDLRQALLRLAPDDRDEILMQAADLTGTRQRAVGWALGQRQPENDREFAISIAAKAGRQDVPPAEALEISRIESGAMPFSWEIAQAPSPGRTQPCWSLTVKMPIDCFDDAIFRCAPLTCFPLVPNAKGIRWVTGKADCLAQIWPGHLAPYFAIAAIACVENLEIVNAQVRCFPEFL